MKKIIGLILIVLSISVQAQDAAKAKALLDKVSAKVKTYKNIQIEFKYTLQNLKENINQENKGNVTLSGNQYVLNFLGVTKMCDGKKLYTISAEDEEISISSVGKNEEDTDTPAKMLTFFNKGFKYAWDITQNVKGKKIQYVKLTPISSKDERKEILVGIDTKTNQVYNTITVGKKGTKVTLTVNSFKTNLTLPKNQFTFVKSKYPNYYINNLD
ncbi:LolA family protein [Flavobacterium humi]|uniref:Outer membrane lipoprotein carrier protein LolA n=1 Tax=Flavobacterium humi TaxID=2562683 RepID=A0A4Z0LC80_9FLAO|nr:outer membrane lipoprotein carrier protein LolA [Flavobacterium humi]TGD59478.1 outer membrane lipoprotein carrier protein LolA [Flavobacterium humi]